MNKDQLQISFEEWLYKNSDLLLDRFENWLYENFHVNIDHRNIKREIFDECKERFTLLRDDNNSSIAYDVDGNFSLIVPVDEENEERILYEQRIIGYDEGKSLMKKEGLRYDLDLDWIDENLIIKSKKLFCLDKKFILRKKLTDVHEQMYKFYLYEKTNYEPFPKNVLINDNGEKISIHGFIINKMLLRKYNK